MTISSKETGNLYLSEETFKIKGPRRGTLTFNVQGHTQGEGGDVLVKIGRNETKYRVLPCTKGTIYGVEFWGEYDDHPKREQTPLSFEYPIK